MARGRFVVPYAVVHYQPDEWTAVQNALSLNVESMRPSEDGMDYEGVGESPHFQSDTITYEILSLLPSREPPTVIESVQDVQEPAHGEEIAPQ